MLRILCLIVYYSFARWFPTQPMPGYRFGYWFRRVLVKRIFSHCGKNVIVKRNACFGTGKGIWIGDNSQLGHNCVVPSDIVMGDNIIMGPEVVIWGISHDFSSVDKPIREQGSTENHPPIIGDDVWIGSRVIIMPGVKIGSHSVIGAASVVTHDVLEWAVVAGIPARTIKMRGSKTMAG